MFTFGQCDLINAAQKSYKSKNYERSITFLEECQGNASIYLSQKIEFQIGICYELLGEDSIANSIFKKLYSTYIFSSREEIDESALDCENVSYDWLDHGGQVHMYYSLLRRLFELSLKDSSYQLALGYIKKMDSVKIIYGCGNAMMGAFNNQILRYAEVYDKMSKPDSALMHILPYLINYNNWVNPKITDYAILIISKNYNLSEVKREFIQAVKKIKEESYTMNIQYYVRLDSLNPSGPAINEVKSIVVKSYSMIFMGNKMILINEKNFSRTEKIPSLKEIRHYCLSSEFYRGLNNLEN